MTHFRYQAVDYSGVLIHGTIEAANHDALVELLRCRGQVLKQSRELTLDSLLESNKATLPRLYQLRVGECIREALLTGLPAHTALRALAAEPTSHPILEFLPWGQAAAFLALGTASGMYLLTQSYLTALITVAFISLVVVPFMTLLLRHLYDMKPRAMLRAMADRLEAGEDVSRGLLKSVPSDLRPVMEANLGDEKKMMALKELIVAMPGIQLQGQRFAFSMLGPFVLLAVMALGGHATFLWVVPSFKEIFSDFGTDLPALTAAMINMSDVATAFGSLGFIVNVLAVFATLVLVVCVLNTGAAGQWLERLPLFGVAFRWSMQARVSRVLGALVRCNCSYPEAVRVACAASGFAQVRREGEYIAGQLESGAEIPINPGSRLSGLPVSILYSKDSGQSVEERRVVVANAFEDLSGMLAEVSRGQGMLFTFVCQFLVVVLAGALTVLGVFALFLPLIKLLNDLS